MLDSSSTIRFVVEAKNRTCVLNMLTELTTSKIYRIDTEKSFQTSSFSEIEHTIVFHDQNPNKSFLNLTMDSGFTYYPPMLSQPTVMGDILDSGGGGGFGILNNGLGKCHEFLIASSLHNVS